MTNVQDRTHDRNHLHRRAFLAATTGALALAGSRTSFAQNQSPDASGSMSRPAMPNNVKVDRLGGSILLIGIRQESDRVELSSVIGLGRLLYLLDTMKPCVSESSIPKDRTLWEASSMVQAGHRSYVPVASRRLPSSSIQSARCRRIDRNR